MWCICSYGYLGLLSSPFTMRLRIRSDDLLAKNTVYVGFEVAKLWGVSSTFTLLMDFEWIKTEDHEHLNEQLCTSNKGNDLFSSCSSYPFLFDITIPKNKGNDKPEHSF